MLKNNLTLLIVFFLGSCSGQSNYLSKAEAAFLEGELLQTIQFSRKHLESRPGDTLALELMAYSFHQLSIPDSTIKYIELLANQNAAAYEAYVILGHLHYQKGNVNAAKKSFGAAYEIDSVGSEVNYNLGIIYWLGYGDHKKAEEYFSREVSINPKNAQAWAARGKAKFDFGESKAEAFKALTFLNLAITIDSTNFNSYQSRGLINNGLGFYKAGLSDINKSISLNPENVEIYKFRGLTYLEMGDTTSACEDFSLYQKLNGFDAFDLLNKYCQG